MKPILSAMLSVSGTKLTDAEKKILQDANPMGVSLFSWNIESQQQVKALTDSIREVVQRETVLIGVDQEGGRVCRFTPPQFRPYISQYSLATACKEEQEEIITKHGQLIADDLHKMNINLNYAPCVDVLFDETTLALKNRCFSSDEKTVALCGNVLLETYIKNGIIPCLKHAPGHGRASVDPHLNLPILKQSLKELEKDFYPFLQLASKAPMMMTAHIVLKEIDDKPVTQSFKVIQEIIREHIGFNGFLISDAIDMKALPGTLFEKAQTALSAGCDAICYCMGRESELQEVVSACSPLSDLALERFEKMIQILSNKKCLSNVDAAEKRYVELCSKTKSLACDYDSVEVLRHLDANKKL